MNNIKTILLKILRSYSTKSASEVAGIRRKLTLTQENDSGVDIEEFDQDDVGMYETDFSEIVESYVNRKRGVQKAREQLRQRIVASKYFKKQQPRFLTYVEKDQIKKLHESNPEDWTPEKLSESFPALPDTIRRVLRSNWVPNSVDTILKYDNIVIENWKNFKTGKLIVDPNLRDHLNKFRNRRISLTDRETLAEHFVRKPVELPKPQTSFFSCILNDSTEKEQLTDKKLLNSLQTNQSEASKQYSKVVEKKPAIFNQEINCREAESVGKYKKGQEKLFFDEFLRRKLNNLDQVTHEERVTLLNTYRKHIESTNADGVDTIVLEKISTEKDPDKGKNLPLIEKLSKESALEIEKRKVKSEIAIKIDLEHSSLETYVKERNSLMETNFHYAKPIKIPKNMYKKGMTYKVNDCYYDDDGEFLYRIPGLKC